MLVWMMDLIALLDREFDADRHCGVWAEETGRPCTHSLTCKVEYLEYFALLVTVLVGGVM